MLEGDDAHGQYEEAKRLYREGRYDDAQELFDDLARRRPDSKHIMFSRALCLAALGRMQEAHFLHDKLASIGGSTARKLTERLDEKFEELQRAKLEEQPDAHKVLHAKAKARPQAARRSSGAWVTFLFGAVVILGVAGAAAFFVLNQSQGGPGGGSSLVVSHTGTGPDRYFEPTTFYPAGTELSYAYAMFLAPPEGALPKEDAKACDCVGAAVASDWPNVKARAQKAVSMAGNRGEELDGTPRTGLVRTAVLPRRDVDVAAALKGHNLQTFSPSAATALDSVTARCGEAEYTEWWVTASRAVGLNGETQWWGNIGLAADQDGAITHLLYRAYPVSME